jgi:hypothetical protein
MEPVAHLDMNCARVHVVRSAKSLAVVSREAQVEDDIAFIVYSQPGGEQLAPWYTVKDGNLRFSLPGWRTGLPCAGLGLWKLTFFMDDDIVQPHIVV